MKPSASTAVSFLSERSWKIFVHMANLGLFLIPHINEGAHNVLNHRTGALDTSPHPLDVEPRQYDTRIYNIVAPYSQRQRKHTKCVTHSHGTGRSKVKACVWYPGQSLSGFIDESSCHDLQSGGKYLSGNGWLFSDKLLQKAACYDCKLYSLAVCWC
jgi:hypothetical protein